MHAFEGISTLVSSPFPSRSNSRRLICHNTKITYKPCRQPNKPIRARFASRYCRMYYTLVLLFRSFRKHVTLFNTKTRNFLTFLIHYEKNTTTRLSYTFDAFKLTSKTIYFCSSCFFSRLLYKKQIIHVRTIETAHV